MAEQIEDGTGTGFRVYVGSDNRMQTRAIQEPEAIHNAELGGSYNFNTGLISITGDATLIYVKNNSDENLIITDIVTAAGDGITHSDFPLFTAVRNPTGGDLITDATAISINQNRNFGSSKTAEVNAYKGKVGGTLTGGNDLLIFQGAKTGRSAFSNLNFLIPKGGSIGVKLTANRSSGTANYYMAFIAYFKDNLDSE